MKTSHSTAPTAEKVRMLLHWLEEHKARQPVALDLTGRGALTEAMIIVTASSVRHGQSLADSLAQCCAQENYEFLRMEGYEAGQWILVDLNDVLVNIFQEPVRELYRLESLWAGPAFAKPDLAGPDAAGERP